MRASGGRAVAYEPPLVSTAASDSTVRGRQKQPAVLQLGEPVGHPGEVIAHHALEHRQRLAGGRHPARRRRADQRRRPRSTAAGASPAAAPGERTYSANSACEHPLAVGRHPQHAVVPVDPLVQEPLQPGLQLPHLRA